MTEATFLAGFADEGASRCELDAHAGVALVVDDLLVTGPPGVRANQHLAQLRDLTRAEVALADQVEQLTLLV